MLYAQRFFNSVLPRITQGARNPESKISDVYAPLFFPEPDVTDPQRQNAYLVALTSLIKAVPKEAYTHELPSVRSTFAGIFFGVR